MQKRKKQAIFAAAIALVCVALAAGCAQPQSSGGQAASADTSASSASASAAGNDAGTDAGEDASSDADATGADATGAQAQASTAAGDFQPLVRTAANGAQYQLSPNEDGNPERLNKPPDIKPYNTYWLKSDQRGCESCHENLATLVESMPDTEHVNVGGIMGDMTVTQCNYCHVGHSSSQPKAEMFGSIIHAIHGLGEGGNDTGISCWTCHDANENGMGTVLWDEVKYDRMIGFTNIAEEDLKKQVEFRWDQDRIIDNDALFAVAWQISDLDRAREHPVPEDVSDEIFDNWTLDITGAVDKPGSYKLTELIEACEPTKEVVCYQCVDNPTGGGLISQIEVTGIPLKNVFEYVGLQENATNYVYKDSIGDSYYSLSTELPDNGYVDMLVYEINGERLTMEKGFPVFAFLGGYEAYYNVMQVAGIEFTAEEGHEHYSQDGLNYDNTPNIGEFDTHEGQIIQAGEPHTFGGYAYAYNNKVTAVEFSMDRGETWDRYDIDNADFNKWVSWYYTWTPEAEANTACVLSMRSIMEDGTVGNVVEKYVNVKAAA